MPHGGKARATICRADSCGNLARSSANVPDTMAAAWLVPALRGFGPPSVPSSSSLTRSKAGATKLISGPDGVLVHGLNWASTPPTAIAPGQFAGESTVDVPSPALAATMTSCR